MPETNLEATIPTPRNASERVDLANQLYREFHTRCFWHSPRNLHITEDLIPFVVKGLRTYGGHLGFRLAGQLLPKEAFQTSDRDILGCP